MTWSEATRQAGGAVIADDGALAGQMVGFDLEAFTLWEISCSAAKAQRHLLDLVMRHGCALWGPMQHVTGGGAGDRGGRASLLVYFPASMSNDDVTCAVIDLFGHRGVWVAGPKRWPVQSHGALLAVDADGAALG